jgi:hypothetical protein
MKKLMKESFTSRDHLAMVREHEARVREYYGKAKYSPQSCVTVNPQGKIDVVEVVPQFTQKQIEIAMSVLEKRERK